MSTMNDFQQRIFNQTGQTLAGYRSIFRELLVSSQRWIARRLAEYSGTKSFERSRHWTMVGDLLKEKGKNEEALLKYNESVAAAPLDSEELYTALMFRTSLLMRIGDYVTCYRDIRRIMEKYQQLRGPKEYFDMEELSRRARTSGVEIDLTNKIRLRMMNAIGSHSYERRFPIQADPGHAIRNRLQPILHLPAADTEPANDSRSDTPAIFVHNPCIPNATMKISVDYDPKYGRHVVADADIIPGEILFFEEPFSAVQDAARARSHCSHCFVRTYSLLSCDRCCEVMFCSAECLDQALKLYHRVECDVLNLLREQVELNSFDLLTLRTTLIGLGQDGYFRPRNNDPYSSDFLTNQRLFVNEKLLNDYHQVCHLQRSTHALPEEVHRNVARKCSYLLYGLTYASFINGSAPAQVSQEASKQLEFVALHLVNNYYVILCNPYTVLEIVLEPNETRVENTLGVALYPFASLVNHSCEPNCSYYFLKNNIIFYANRSIAYNEQLFSSYGPQFTLTKREERWSRLAQYGFQCECDACRMDWPTLVDLPRFPNVKPNADLKILHRKMEALKKKALQIQWNKMNLNAVDALLEFHREFAPVLHAFFVKPNFWSVSSQREVEKLMEMYGSVFVPKTENDIVQFVETIISYVLSTDIRTWLPDTDESSRGERANTQHIISKIREEMEGDLQSCLVGDEDMQTEIEEFNKIARFHSSIHQK